ncbi:FISUMP domain-containing protein [candidate division KSB1 bacterium]
MKRKNYLVLITLFFTVPLFGQAGIVTDIDGNVYNTIKIGSQWWMVENLKVTRYSNGDSIEHVTNDAEWAGLSSGAYCSYDNNTSNSDIYGFLYNWYAVNDSRRIAPEGWHVPTDDDWKELEMYLGISQSEADSTGWHGTDEGGKLKADTTLWNSPNEGATNETGFSAIPGGFRAQGDGVCHYIGSYAHFWSATEYSSIYAWYRHLDYSFSGICRDKYDKKHGFSVRCIKDVQIDSVADIDGNVYQTIIIGNQEWMVENLRVTKYRNGDVIPNVTDSLTWTGLATDAYCDYNNDSSNVMTYGRLYNWYVVNDSRGIAPEGWHMPTDNDWKALEMYLGMSQSEADVTDAWRGMDEGGKLKEAGTSHWTSPNTGATNESGFNAIASGYRSVNGSFLNRGNRSQFWSASEFSASEAWRRLLYFDQSGIYRGYYLKGDGLSVRCVRAVNAGISLPETSVFKGDTIILPITLTNIDLIDSVFSFQLRLGFDNTKLEFLEYDLNGFLADSFNTFVNTSYPDSFLIAGSSENAVFGSDTLLTVKFRVNPSATNGLSYINFCEFLLNEETSIDLLNGRINIFTGLFGDVSQNKEVTAYDASLILQHTVDLITLTGNSFTAAEVSGNGAISAYDASYVLRLVVGYISGFPVGSMFKFAHEENISAFFMNEYEDIEQIEYSVSIENSKNLYSLEFEFQVESLELESCDLSEITKDYLIEKNIKGDKLKISLAGYNPVAGQNEIIKLKLKKVLPSGVLRLIKAVGDEKEITIFNTGYKIPADYSLEHNYPNPFNPATTLKYSIPRTSIVNLKIYNILGQEIKTLINEKQPAGYHSVKWDGTNNNGVKVNSGVYVYRLQTGDFVETKKMVLMK